MSLLKFKSFIKFSDICYLLIMYCSSVFFQPEILKHTSVQTMFVLKSLVAFLGTFWNFMLLFGIFFSLFGSLGPFTLFCRVRFVVIYAFCRVKYLGLKTCLFKKLSFYTYSCDAAYFFDQQPPSGSQCRESYL